MKLVKTVKHHTIAEHEGFFYIYDEPEDFDIDMSDGVPSRWGAECAALTEAEAACDCTINHDDYHLTEYQAAVLTAFTGHMLGKFSVFHKYAEKLIGRPIFKHELGSQEMKNKLEKLSKADFLNLQP